MCLQKAIVKSHWSVVLICLFCVGKAVALDLSSRLQSSLIDSFTVYSMLFLPVFSCFVKATHCAGKVYKRTSVELADSTKHQKSSFISLFSVTADLSFLFQGKVQRILSSSNNPPPPPPHTHTHTVQQMKIEIPVNPFTLFTSRLRVFL